MIRSVVIVALAASPSLAQTVSPPAVSATAILPQTGGRLAARTPVELRIVGPLGSRLSTAGQGFAIELASDVRDADNRILLPAGLRGVGEVVHARKGGGAGKPGELVLAARRLTCGTTEIPLGWFEMAKTGDLRTGEALAVSMAVSFAGFLVKGGEVEVAPGTRAAAKVRSDVEVPAACTAATITKGE